ncbi:MAG: chromate transporter, partial [Alphaproteobacteria bacterium]|nr:chromate transporter [Alphaproteobacteria bacterium]
MQKLFELLLLFAKVGLFTFGGGYAMLPLLKAETVQKRGFLTEEELLDLYSIGQCTPGIIAINVATFIGYRQKGVWGAIFATLGMVLPSLIIIVLIATILKQYMYNRYVAYAFAGIRICVVALIADIVYELWKKNIKIASDVIIFVGTVVLLAMFKI